ncbi:MAG TPA: hypothetical protein PK325_00885 [Cyclobacteriaceae bacterium]|nr:cytochrome P460 family protein [Cyclobacteriaceae bacterium]HMV08176.1 hypothetical protein [Cyclobacteriaceae bacterium]HMX00817.1 hypothetical protein [Cyclobacteriaceae bacterium]HMX49308.1 hypothetical protein [Cyclobacteriaceae bacterium]HMY93620.1 hypothetical protein [Cyclobacteriaceae bacterium]
MKKFNRLVFIIGLLIAGCAKEQHHDLYNESASRLDVSEIGFNPLEGEVISTFINTKDTTMSTLYANDSAARHAEQRTPYADGDLLSLVTWKQREDPYWFGGNIPDKVATIEIVRFESGRPVYSTFVDNLLKSHNEEDRIKFMTGIQRSEFP